ncbi:MAG: hypothetical protein Q8R83_10975 [Legionellaceae bacterium]|nr:hypothetical protein [Legionellaceae bacterium]
MDYKKYKNLPIYKKLWQNDSISILEKSDIVADFPHHWLTPKISAALAQGDVEWLASSGTTSDRMQIMRPASWGSEHVTKNFMHHPVLKKCWDEQITRIVLAPAVCSQSVCFNVDPGPDKRWYCEALFINLSNDPQTWQKSDIDRMVKEISDNAPYFIIADPIYLALLLKNIKKYNLEHSFIKPKAVVLSYEIVTHNIRQYIEDILAVPIIGIYGSTELNYVLIENNQGNMELCSPEIELSEIELELLPLVPELNLYSLIVSSIKNPYMPFIRYRTGDCVQTVQNKHPQIKRICGREKERIKIQNGTLIPHAIFDDLIAKHSADIMLYQLQGLGSERMQFNYTTIDNHPLDEHTATLLQTKISSLIGKTCNVFYRDTISPAISGKFNWLKML